MSQHHEAEAAVRTMGGLGVRAVRLLYTDLHGVARGKDIPIGHFERHVRGGGHLLRGRDGHRPPAHAGRRRRGRLRRLRDQARPRHAARRAVAAGGRLVPRRGLDARRLRALAVVPAGAAAPGRRRVRGAGPDADRRPGARVLPRRARPRGGERPAPLRRRALPRLHGRCRLGSARDRAQDAALVRRPRAAGVRREPRVHELPVRDQRQALGGARRGRPRVHAQGSGEGDRGSRGPARDLHGPPICRPGRIRLPRAPVAERRGRQATPSPTRAAPQG